MNNERYPQQVALFLSVPAYLPVTRSLGTAAVVFSPWQVAVAVFTLLIKDGGGGGGEVRSSVFALNICKGTAKRMQLP